MPTIPAPARSAGNAGEPTGCDCRCHSSHDRKLCPGGVGQGSGPDARYQRGRELSAGHESDHHSAHAETGMHMERQHGHGNACHQECDEGKC
jgi:hypothetical protein